MTTQKKKKNTSAKYTDQWLEKCIEEIEADQEEKLVEKSLKKAKDTLQNIVKMGKESKSKHEGQAKTHHLIGNSYLIMGEYHRAVQHHTLDLEMSKQKKSKKGKARARENLGRAYEKLGNYEGAIALWRTNLKVSESALESTWLYYNIGNCELKINCLPEAMQDANVANMAAQKSEDETWILLTTMLIANIHVKLEDWSSAQKFYSDCLQLSMGDEKTQQTIHKALDKVNKKHPDQSKEPPPPAKPKKLRKKLTPEEKAERQQKKQLEESDRITEQAERNGTDTSETPQITNPHNKESNATDAEQTQKRNLEIAHLRSFISRSTFITTLSRDKKL